MRLEALLSGLIACLSSVAARPEPLALSRHPLHEGWRFRQVGRAEDYPATVPGVVHLDLMRNALVGDPFYRDYEAGQQWIGKTDWEYRTVFELPAEILGRRHVDLVFDGLDTYAKVTLNGQKLLEANNMFRQWRIAVRPWLRPKGNELVVVFRSPIREDLPKVAADGYERPAVHDLGEKTSVYTRKAPYSFGGDLGPRLVTCGIWKPVRLEAWDDVRIVDVVVRQKALDSQTATLTAEVELVLGRPFPAGSGPSLEVAVEGSGMPVASKIPLREGIHTQTVPFEIVSPRLWWPNGYGGQPLYRVTTRLVSGTKVLDEKRTRIGLRSLELRRRKDEFGTSFEFVVNGVAVFAKGANWVPADSLLPRVGRERYRQLLRAAKDAHMNMLRVWGGGIYESDDFYDLADEAGLLVWQDFPFAGGLYPARPEFLANVEAEAEDAIRRLRNHPSLALWNGNDEIEAGWFERGWKERLPEWLWSDYKRIFHDLLPRSVGRLDPARGYWPSSPSANLEALPGDCCIGDRHDTVVWQDGEPVSRFESQSARFLSEYGLASLPEMSTIRWFARWDDLTIDSPVMRSHQRELRESALVRELLAREYRPPKDFASFVYLSQVQQAEAVKLGAERLRRSRPRTMGSLYGQLDDCWPGASWSSIDYFGRWKALHYYARRFYAPLLASVSEQDGQLTVTVVSDRNTSLTGQLVARLLDFAGGVLWQQVRAVEVGPLESRGLLTATLEELLAGHDPKAVFLQVQILENGQVAASNLRFFAPARELALSPPQITVQMNPAPAGFLVRLSSNTLARHVRLEYAAGRGRFEDNYFDLLPGQPVEVIYQPEGELSLAALERGIEVHSLVESY